MSDFERYRLRAERAKHLEELLYTVKNLLAEMAKPTSSAEIIARYAEVRKVVEHIDALPPPDISNLKN